MGIQRRHVGVLALLFGGGLVFGPGCAENQSSLFIRAALVVPADTCTVSPDSSAETLFRGSLDIALAAEHHGALLVGNQLVPRGNQAQLKTETSRIQLTTADVTVYSATGAELGAFSVPISGFVDPGSASSPGYGAAEVVMVDAASATAALGGGPGPIEVISSVILHGTTLGGKAVDSGEWQFPIDICNGCTIIFPAEADDPTKAGVDCDIRDDAPVNCHIGIDLKTDCRSCAGVIPQCTP